MTDHRDQPDLRAALAALEHDAVLPDTLIEAALSPAGARDGALSSDGAARPRSRAARWAAVAGAAAVIAVVAAVLAIVRTGSGTAPPATSNSPNAAAWRTYTQTGFSVRHPASWHAYPLREAGSFIVGIVSLSTVPVPAACTTSTTANGNTRIDCGPPTAPLGDGGVLLSWTVASGPSLLRGKRSVLAGIPGRTTRIDNRDAKIAITAPDRTCDRSNGDRTITVTIAISEYTALGMDACLAGTGHQLTGLTHAVIASARSVHYGHPTHHTRPNPPPTSTSTRPAAGQFRIRLVISDTTVPANGNPIHGYVLAINHTGRPSQIRDAHCDSWVQAGLSGRHVHFSVASLDVLCPSSQLHRGTTRIPVTIATTYNGCQQGKRAGTPDLPHCLGPHDSTIPALPAGRYHVHVGTQNLSRSPVLPRPVLVRLLTVSR